METKLREYLRKDERICWQGQPEAFPLLADDSKTAILCKWALTVMIAGGLLGAYLRAQHEPQMGFVIGVLAGAAILLLLPFIEKRSLMKSRYWITDQRVIQMTKDHVFYYMDLTDVDDFKIVKDETVRDSLAVGNSVFEEARKHIRWRASHPKEDPEAMKERDHVDGMILYNIGNAESAAALLEELGCGRTA